MSDADPGPDDSRSAPARFATGSLVAWAGPAELGRDLHLEPGHPGEVRSPEPMAVTVRWIDRAGWFNHVGVFQQEWLEPLDAAEFERRRDQLRSADWAGFPPGEY